jgi:hypothetical protein
MKMGGVDDGGLLGRVQKKFTANAAWRQETYSTQAQLSEMDGPISVATRPLASRRGIELLKTRVELLEA